jgi:hypothetical protein
MFLSNHLPLFKRVLTTFLFLTPQTLAFPQWLPRGGEPPTPHFSTTPYNPYNKTCPFPSTYIISNFIYTQFNSSSSSTNPTQLMSFNLHYHTIAKCKNAPAQGIWIYSVILAASEARAATPLGIRPFVESNVMVGRIYKLI